MNENSVTVSQEALPDVMVQRLRGMRSDLISALHETEQALIWLGALSQSDRALMTREERRERRRGKAS